MVDRNRVKLLIKFFESIGNHTIALQKPQMLNENMLQIPYQKPNFKHNTTQSFANIYDKTGQKLNKTPLSAGNLYTSQPQNTSFPSLSHPYHASLLEIPDKKTNKNKQIIQVFKNGDQIEHQINIDPTIHGSILNRDVVGPAFIFNQKGTKFLYIANSAEKTGKHFMETEFDEDKHLEEALLLNKHQQDYGEQMKGIIQPEIYQYDIESGELSKIQIPEDVFPCFPQYVDANGDKLIFQGYKMHPEFKYGILHCFNRESSIYLLENLQKKQVFPPKKDEKKQEQEKEKVQFKIISEERVATHPRVSPDLSQVLYFASPFRPPHLNYLSIKTINLTQNNQIKTIQPFSQQYKKNQFMGVCGFYSDLQSSQWLKDSKNYIFSCIQEGKSVLYMVNTETSQIEQISHNNLNSDVSELLSYDPENNIIFSTHENPQQPKILRFLPLPAENENMDLKSLKNQWVTIDQYKDSKDNILAQLQQFLQDNLQEEILEIDGGIQATFWYIKDFSSLKNAENLPKIVQEIWQNNENLNPLTKTNEQRPLIVNIHGGPHAGSLGYFSTLKLFQLLSGYNILAPNYTGSAGYGMDHIEKLQGQIGELDKKEILKFVDLVIEKKLCDPKQIIAMGGSYGGYMSGIFASRHPEIFKCAILLNPVLNLAFNYSITDIPEWQMSTVFGKEMGYNLTVEDYKKLIEHSPCKDPAQIPILQILGKEDKRVPYQQGLAYQAQALAHGTEVETYVYQEANHSLNDSLYTQLDYMLKICIFIEKQLLK